MKSISNIWKIRYLQLAKQISTWSKDPSTKVGAVCVGEYGHILAQGYNGFPRGFSDNIEEYNNRELKYKYVVHAEMNCLYHATINGLSLKDSTMFIYGLDMCHECAKGIIQSGIKEVVTCYKPTSGSNWKESFILTKEILHRGGVKHEKINYKSIS